jgi:hypothetical protein
LTRGPATTPNPASPRRRSGAFPCAGGRGKLVAPPEGETMDDSEDTDPAPLRGFDVTIRLTEEQAAELTLHFQNLETNEDNEARQHYS